MIISNELHFTIVVIEGLRDLLELYNLILLLFQVPQILNHNSTRGFPNGNGLLRENILLKQISMPSPSNHVHKRIEKVEPQL